MGRAQPGFETMSLDDFEELLLDKPEHEKWELIGRRVIRGMVGARWDHHTIVANMATTLRVGLRAKGSPCRTYAETFWLKQRFLDLAVFPDVMVHCGPVPKDATAIGDPVILFEVVSGGSVKRDRVDKWQLYQKLPSLQHYVLVERDLVAVDVFDRVTGGWFSRPRVETMSASLLLPAIDFSMTLEEIYRDVMDA